MLILLLAAVIPAAYLMVKVYQADRLEKEPAGLLLSLLALGVISTALASVAERLGDLVLAWFVPEGTLLYDAVMYFGIVAFAEEGFKYLLLKNRTWNSPHFNCQFDGVVYAVFVSLGFALWENIGYVFSYGLGAAVARALTAVPGHACFGVFMGVWYGAARRWKLAGYENNCKRALRCGVVIPALLHGCYDFIAVRQRDSLSLVFLAFVAIMFIAALRVVRRMARNDFYLDDGSGGLF